MMIKQMGCFCFCFLLALSGQGQLSGGLKAGLNLSTVHRNNDFTRNTFNVAPLAAPHVGVFAAFPLAGRWSFQPEVLLSVQGFRNEQFSTINGVATAQERQLYLSIPLLLGLKLGSLTLEAGPEPGWRLQARTRVDGESMDNPLFEKGKWELGFDLGLRYQWDRLGLGLRYHLGLSPVLEAQYTDANGVPVDDPVRLSNRMGQLYLAFDLLRKEP